MGMFGTEEIVGLVGLVLVGLAAFALGGWWGVAGLMGGLMIAGALVLALVRGSDNRRR